MLALVLALGGTGYAATQGVGGVKLVYAFRDGSVAPRAAIALYAVCPSGTRPTGGGFDTAPAKDVTVLSSGPADTSTGKFVGGSVQAANVWSASFLNNGTTAAAVSTYAACAPE